MELFPEHSTMTCSSKKKCAKLVPHTVTDFDCRRRLEFAHEMLSQYAHDPRCLQWIVTSDKSWFHVYDPRSCFENKEWLQKGENRAQVVAHERNVKKVMLIPFFDHQGLVHWEYFKNCTITKHVLLPVLQRAWESIKKCWGSAIWTNHGEYHLHFDNAPAHRGDIVLNFLHQENWKTHSPPLTPLTSPLQIFFYSQD